jgi:ribosomal protein L40E
MIVCTNCGHENADDATFCESCQNYLEWGKARVEPEPELAQVAPDGHDAPAAILPDEEYDPPVRVRPKPVVEPQPGELICDQCGTGNRAVANFCRRCGASLANASIAQRPPWWRRLLARRRRTYAAGERRRRARAQAQTGAQRVHGGLRGAMRIVAILSLVGVVSITAIRTNAVERSRDLAHSIRVFLFPHYVHAIPTSFHATSSLRGHEADKAFDQDPSTSWAEAVPGDGRGQKVVARFDRGVDLVRVGVTLGDADHPQTFLKQPVPHRLRLRAWHNRTLIASKVLFLAQERDFQRFSFEAKDTTRVVATIMTVFHSRTGHAATLRDVELFETK